MSGENTLPITRDLTLAYAFNLVVGMPLLLGSMWLTRRGSFAGLLLWPSAHFYVLHW